MIERLHDGCLWQACTLNAKEPRLGTTEMLREQVLGEAVHMQRRRDLHPDLFQAAPTVW